MKNIRTVYFFILLFCCLSEYAGALIFCDDFNAGSSGWTDKVKWISNAGVKDSGALSISANTDGKGSVNCHGPELDLNTGAVYGMRFKARSQNAAGGTFTTGTGFFNVDIGVPGTEWKEYSYYFAVPSVLNNNQYLKFGQWQCSGDFLLDDLEVVELEPVYFTANGVVLGDGESVNGNSYIFNTYFNGKSRNHCRPLSGFSAGFNSQRWCIGTDSYVDYIHELPSRKLNSLTVNISCGYYQKGAMQVMVSADAKKWETLGEISSTGSSSFSVPETVFPADRIYVRMSGSKKGCELQIYDYGVTATFTGRPVNMKGHTFYVEKIRQFEVLDVAVSDISFEAESQRGSVQLRVSDKENNAFSSKAEIVCVNAEKDEKIDFSRKFSVARGDSAAVTVPFSLNQVGEWKISLLVGDGYASCFNITVPEFYDNSYGALLPVKGDKLALWQASSGWKIPRGRSLPSKKERGLVVSLAANERESIQLVLNSSVDLKNVLLNSSEFADGRNILPADVVEFARVGYVPVKQPTDGTGVVADWPDPVFPQNGPCDLKAGVNHPYWIRVSLPKGVKPGEYDGRISVKADGISEKVKLRIKVYGFELPDRMSCESAFGMNHNRIFQHHRVKTLDDKRVVIDKYLNCLSENHISPYNPAPLDPWKAEFCGLPAWRGGSYDNENAYEGKWSYRVVDDNEKGNVNAKYAEKIQLSGNPLKVCFAHRSDKPQRTLFTMNYFRKDGSWISGNNRDIWVSSTPEWKHEEVVVKSFNKEAVSFEISLWGAGYFENESSVGTTCFDSIVISEADGGKVVFNDGDFEAPRDVSNNIAVKFDWPAWDAQMDRAFNEFHFNSFRFDIQGLGGGTFMSRYEPEIAGIREGEPAYSILMEKYLSGAENHLKEKGWLADAYIYWFDEPDPKDYEFVMNGFRKLKKYAPRLRRMLTEQVEQGLVDGPNLWCPLTPNLNVDGIEDRRNAGDEFWWYVCCGPKAPYVTLFIDHPGAEMRLWLWQTWQERITGILIWETVYWHSHCAYPDSLQNPYEDSMAWVNHVEKGEREPWGNGDGRFMYPPQSVYENDGPVTDGPVPTVRLEMLRDGLEDYEYFVILKKLLAEKRDKLSPRKLEKYSELLKVPADVSRSLTDFNIDPSAMERHRDSLARAIEALCR